MISPAKTTPPIVLALAALLAGCGGGHKQGQPIPQALAGNMIARLQEADRRAAAHACHDLRTQTIPILEQYASQMPATVDSNVRATVSDGIAHLNDLVSQQCASSATTTTSTPTTATSLPTTTFTPTTTQTTPPPPTTTTTRTTPTTTHTTSPPAQTSPSGGGLTPPPGAATGVGPDGNGPPGHTKHDPGAKGKGAG